MTALQRNLLRWYRRHGRATLPWRARRSPYRTTISEFMLAQTQVERVVPSFEAFVERFADFTALARASPAAVLRAWKGLGYNSRAVRLQRLAAAVVKRHAGVLPPERAALLALPGVGPYVAAAIRAFAFDLDDAPVDTNVRRVVHRLCFGIEHPPAAGEREIAERAQRLVPAGRGHDWSSAMMDLGATMCTARAPKCSRCPLRRVCAAAPIDAARLDRRRETARKGRSPQQALPFERTTRHARGRIVDRLRELPPGRRISLVELHATIEPSVAERGIEEMGRLVRVLERDGLVTADGDGVALRE